MSFRLSMEFFRFFQTIAAGVSFGFWQWDIMAGISVFATLTALDLIVTCGIERAKA